MSDVIIRPAMHDDLPELLALYRQLHPDDPTLDPDHAVRTFSSLLASGLMTVVVAALGRSLVSTCVLAIVPNLSRGGRPYGIIENVVTHADHRRTGLGHRVLAHALGIAWDADCYKVSLATGSKQDPTLKFYERAGFARNSKTYFEIRRP
jgi:GNAT superfamily N-acetyltransferase